MSSVRTNSPLRKAQAAATRRAIIDAAAASFIERGYVATSIETIAEAAGVSRATVFTSVGGKKELLKKAYDVALVGDDEPIPFPLRPASLAVRAEPDPRRFLVGLRGPAHRHVRPARADLRGRPRGRKRRSGGPRRLRDDRHGTPHRRGRTSCATSSPRARPCAKASTTRGGGHPVGPHRCRAVPSPRPSTGLDEGALPGVAGRDRCSASSWR